MAIPWKPVQRQAVYAVLQRYPAESGRCDEAASKLLPIAQECDSNAHLLRIVPSASAKLKKARFIVPLIKTTKSWLPWSEHYTTEVVLHCVDALTGPDGTASSAYLKTHWKHPQDLELQPA
jgi:hypothetical protein